MTGATPTAMVGAAVTDIFEPMRFRRPTLVALLAVGLAGCLPSPVARHQIPRGLIETARVPGYENVRVWADESSPVFAAAILAKDQQERAAIDAGRMQGARTKADFLAISGGGDQGAFAAGVLTGWTERGTRPSFEVVTGVSAGALAAPFAFIGPSEDAALRDIFTQMSAGDLYASRGVWGYFDDSLEDTSKLRHIIEHYATTAFLDRIAAGYHDGRRILILTTNLDAERPMIWDLTAIAASPRSDRREIFVKVLMASSAVPGIFPPVFFPVVTADGRHYDEMHVDGGVTAQLVFVPPEVSVVDIEKKAFGNLRERNLYVIRNGKIVPEYDVSEPRAVSIASRAVTTLVKYQVISDLGRLNRYAQSNGTGFRFCAVPAGFDAPYKTEYDEAYAAKLFAAGVTLGIKDEWSTTPPTSPELFMR